MELDCFTILYKCTRNAETFENTKRFCCKISYKSVGGRVMLFSVGIRIKEARMLRGISQRELARRINRSYSAMCAYESGEQNPPLEVFFDIARELNVSLDSLAGYDSSSQICISGLNQNQRELLFMLIDEFTSVNKHEQGLSESQILILQKLFSVFNQTNN